MARAAGAHALDPSALARELDADLEHGLTAAEAADRLERFGRNHPQTRRRPPYARLAARQLRDPLVALLVAATGVSIAIGQTVEGAAIAAVLVLNGVLGFWQELAAERAIHALGRTFTQSAVALRDGVERELPAEEVVPGDVLVVREGERVAADARVLAAEGLEADESALTGESLPVEKRAEAVPPDTPLAERRSMVYAGTGVTRGRGRALVCATGPATELGQIEAMAAGAKPPPTPLQRRLGGLARQMVVLGTFLTLALAGVMLARGESLESAFLVGVAVAVAAVPEGLAATVTAALALGARAMAGRGALVRRLAAIETLGEATVVCTDKTGTLTENQIRVAAIRTAAGVGERALLQAAVLASSARPGAEGRVLGDPIEAALLLAAMERGLSYDEVRAGFRRIHEIPFDSERRRMTVVYEGRGGRRAFTKGAPELLCGGANGAGELRDAANAWAGEGFRVLVVGTRDLAPGASLDESVESEFEPLGVVALHDPLRATAASALADARRAGVAVRMLTGDHPATARTIGHALGLADGDVLARATPAEKLALVRQLQREGEVVAVTGDGVNDSPALRRADVGIAMGRSGTEAAREAAAIVLTDDDFATIVAAIGEGRRIGDNIRKFIAFLLSANLGEVLVFAAAIASGLGAPLAVVQVLVVNLVTDGLPAVALTQDPPSAETMTRAPRRGGRLFDRTLWLALGAVGLVVGASTFAAFVAGRSFGGADVPQTMAFATLAFSELALVFGIRSTTSAAWRLPANTWLTTSVLGSAALVAAVLYVPFAHEPFATASLGFREVIVVVALALAPLAFIEVLKALRRRPRAVAGFPA
jgi:Ca2+-transporting ATPase